MNKVLLGLTYLILPIGLCLKVSKDNHIGILLAFFLLVGTLAFILILYFSDKKKASLLILSLGLILLLGNIVFFKYLISVDIKIQKFYQAVAYIQSYYRKHGVIPDNLNVEKICGLPRGMEVYIEKDKNDLKIWTNLNYGYGFSYFIYSNKKAQAILVE